MKRYLALVLATWLVIAAALPRTAGAAADWQADPAWPQFHHLTGITYGDGQFVALGEYGTIMTSPDGERWQLQHSPTREFLSAVAYGNGQYLATLGPMYVTPGVLTSPDGVTWTRHAAPAMLTAAAFCDGEFWATVQYPAALVHSRDGVTWQTELLPVADGYVPLNRVACGGGAVVAMTGGWDAAPMLIATWDGRQVTTQHPPADMYQMNAIAYGDGQFLLLGSRPLRSADGKTWTAGPDFYIGPSGLAYGDGHWTALSFSGSAVSTDGLTWQPQIDGNGVDGVLTYGNGRFVAAGLFGATARSADGLTWQKPSVRQDAGLVFANGLFVAMGQGQEQSGTKVSVSEDGLTWTTATVGGRPILLFYDHKGRRFAAVTGDGDKRSLYTSADGRTWSGPAAMPDYVGSVIETGDSYLALGTVWSDAGANTLPTGRLYRSRDLTAWAELPAPAGYPAGMAYNGSTYVYTAREVDPNGGRWIAGPPLRSFLYTSADAVTWTRHDVPVEGAAACNGQFIGGGGRTSADGLTWTDWVSGAPGMVTCAGDGRLLGVSVGAIYSVMVSSDGGRTWGELEDSLGAQITGVAMGNGRLVTVGSAPVATTLRCGDFLDVAAADPACGPLKELKARSVMGGFPGGLMRPEDRVTRAQLAKLLVLTLGGNADPGGSLPFADTAGHWAAGQGWLQAVAGLGAINGYPDGTFRPDGPVTRAELVKIVVAAAHLDGTGAASYADVPADAWYAPWVSRAAGARLIGPGALFAGDRFLPDQPATRAETAMLLSNLLHR